jgi:raffinose/stachyose/melibiose transport system substrate-binding protein
VNLLERRINLNYTIEIALKVYNPEQLLSFNIYIEHRKYIITKRGIFMKNKKLVCLCCLILSVALLLVACSSGTKPASSSSTSSYVPPVYQTGSIQIVAAVNDTLTQNTEKSIVSDFELLYPKISVNLIFATSNNVDSMMQVRMAANDLPDIMCSTIKLNIYGNYLEDLSKEPWASQIISDYLPTVSNAKGQVLAFPAARGITGLSYNVSLLNQYGIDPDTTLTTMAGWINDCKTIKQKSNGSVESFFIGNANGQLSLFYSYMADGAFINDNTTNAPALLKGTFDWSQWTSFAEEINSMTQFFNSDYLTAKQNDALNAYAQSKAVFYWGQDDTSGLKALNPNIDLSYVPMPAWKAGQNPYFVSDVRSGWSIFNTTKNLDDSRLFLDFLSQQNEVDKICVVDGFLPCLKGYDINTFDMTRLATFKNVPYIPYFTNKWLPAGMGSYITTDSAEYALGKMTAQQFSDDMKTNYLRILAATSST